MVLDILVLEPSAKLQSVLVDYFRRGGYSCEGAGDSASALQRINQTPPRLLLIDMHLPDSASPKLLAHVRGTLRIPIIAMSAQLKKPEEYRPIAQQFKLQAFFPKPFDFEQLYRSSAKLIGPPPKTPQQAAAAPSPVPAPTPTSAPAPAAAKTEPADQGFQGDLAKTEFYRLLLHILDKRYTGELYIRREASHPPHKIVFTNGRPVAVYDPKGVDTFANFLQSRGTLTLEEQFVYEEARERSLEFAEGMLIKMGVLTPEGLVKAKQAYYASQLYTMFTWRTGIFLFRPLPYLGSHGLTEAINVYEVIHRGVVESIDKQDVSNFFLKRQGKYIAIDKGLYEYQFFLALSSLERDLLGGLNGRRLVRELVNNKEFDAEDLLRSLFVFDLFGMVRYGDSPMADKVKAAFPVRETPASLEEEAGFVKVRVEDIISGKITTRQQLEETQAESEADEAEKESGGLGGAGFDLGADLADELGDLGAELGDVLDAPSAPVSLASLGKEVAQATDPAQDALEKRVNEVWASLKNKNYYEVLGMKFGGIDFGKMKSEYHKLVKEFSPEKFLMSSSETMSKSEEILSTVAKAFNTLSNVVAKEAYDETIAGSEQMAQSKFAGKKLHIKVQFNSGLAFLKEGDFSDAEQAFREVCEIDPDNGDALAHLAWAVYANPARRGKLPTAQGAIRQLNRAIELNPRCAYAYAYKGQVLLELDKVTLAEVEFKKALQMKPDLKMAKKGVESITAKRNDENRGFFGRLRA